MRRAYAHLAFAVVLFAILVIGYAFWYHALGAKRVRVASLTSEVAGQAATEAKASEASDALSKLGTDKAAIRAYFVDPDDVVSFLENLQKLGSNLGASVEVVSVTAEASPRPHLDLALTVSGSFDAVVGAAGAIEYAPYDITVSSLTLDTANADIPDQAPWTAAMTLSVGTASSSPATTSP